ncbi:MAG: DUF4258 domain-containing protein [Halobacteriota archaeon]|nr:DUF4258 domain-containing protein [Halobacteriota archaeon]
MLNKINLDIIRGFITNDKFIISNHARIRMFQRNISTDDVKNIIIKGVVIEEYPDDVPCVSVLILGFLDENPYHVVVAQCEDHARIITVYRPEEDKWMDHKIRKKEG